MTSCFATVYGTYTIIELDGSIFCGYTGEWIFLTAHGVLTDPLSLSVSNMHGGFQYLDRLCFFSSTGYS